MNPTPTLDDGRREPVDVDVDRLLSDPIYAADECLRVYRVMRAKCGVYNLAGQWIRNDK